MPSSYRDNDNSVHIAYLPAELILICRVAVSSENRLMITGMFANCPESSINHLIQLRISVSFLVSNRLTALKHLCESNVDIWFQFKDISTFAHWLWVSSSNILEFFFPLLMSSLLLLLARFLFGDHEIVTLFVCLARMVVLLGYFPTTVDPASPLCLYFAPAQWDFSQITSFWALASCVKPEQIDSKYV